MITLYRRDSLGRFEYREAWVVGGAVIEHWGAVGARGERRTVDVGDTPPADALARLAEEARAAGYDDLPPEAFSRIAIELPAFGRGGAADVARREALQEELQELLGWTGLGTTVEGTERPGAMVVVCSVVDVDAADRCIRRALLGTEFDDYRVVA